MNRLMFPVSSNVAERKIRLDSCCRTEKGVVKWIIEGRDFQRKVGHSPNLGGAKH
jgi:hypothetical protein